MKIAFILTRLDDVSGIPAKFIGERPPAHELDVDDLNTMEKILVHEAKSEIASM